MSLSDVWPAPLPADRKYRKAADSIAHLLAAGRELLTERGLAPGLGRVTLNDAIERSGIPRSSAYRLYQGGDGPLESYRVALLADVIEDFVHQAERFEVLEQILDEHFTAVGSQTAEERAVALREVIRVGIDAHVMSWSRSTEWQAVSSAVIASTSHASTVADDRPMLADAVLRLTRGALPLYREMARLGGLVLRPGTDWDEFARVVSAGIEGAAIRSIVDPTMISIRRPTGPGGSLQRWNAAAIIFESLFASYLMPDPASHLAADLSTWHR